MDPQLGKVVALVGQVFEEADLDKSGLLSQQEFSAVLRRKSVIHSFKEAGMSVDDFKVLFAKLDVSGLGTVLLDELCSGLVRMKKSMMGQERILGYLRKIFEDADVGDSGCATKEDVCAVLMKTGVQSKLQMLGVPSEDVEDLWAAVDAQETDGRPGITAEDVVAIFLALREDNSTQARGLNFLRLVFKEATGDLIGGVLDRTQFKEAFCTERVEQKIEKLGLTVPDWLDIFDALDVDDDRRLSWEEILHGIRAMWTTGEVDGE